MDARTLLVDRNCRRAEMEDRAIQARVEAIKESWANVEAGSWSAPARRMREEG